MKILDVVRAVEELTEGAPYAVIGGLAQILWARKTHTDDVDIALAAGDLSRAFARVEAGDAGTGWTLPRPPDVSHERDDVIDVYHVHYRGTVVDLLTFARDDFTQEILKSARSVPELGTIRFIRPELLLVTHLLRPGVHAALAAVELLVSRRALGGFDAEYAEAWAAVLGKLERYQHAVRLADEASTV